MVKWAVRYGPSLRKRYLAIVEQKKERYVCDVCGKKAVKRISTGIWKWMSCGATFAGGAYEPSTRAGESAKRLIEQINQINQTGKSQASPASSGPSNAATTT
jgi:LSU ribosomal protein L37AE